MRDAVPDVLQRLAQPRAAVGQQHREPEHRVRAAQVAQRLDARHIVQ